jgi:hypothetical protein
VRELYLHGILAREKHLTGEVYYLTPQSSSSGFQPSVQAGEATILGAIAGQALARRLATDESQHLAFHLGSTSGPPEGIRAEPSQHLSFDPALV